MKKLPHRCDWWYGESGTPDLSKCSKCPEKLTCVGRKCLINWDFLPKDTEETIKKKLYLMGYVKKPSEEEIADVICTDCAEEDKRIAKAIMKLLEGKL